ncbi:MAG TPA: PRC-barrel domain-containing protein [Micropepsaceae bacterium]|nr:PRC-barrel domain-containing protein [Micropepsaceae bacterium]
MTSHISRIILTAIAFGAFIPFIAGSGDSASAANSTAASRTSNAATTSRPSRPQDAAHERTALGAIGRARYAAQNRKPKEVLDQIERAETALLNIAQAYRDPHVDTALEHMAAARASVGRNDLRSSEAELAQATRDLTVALALAAPGDALVAVPTPMIGTVVYDADADEVGDVTEVIFDPNGNVTQIVIGVGDFLGTGEKNVAVPTRQVAMANDRVTVGLTKDQLRQAQNYRLPDYGG